MSGFFLVRVDMKAIGVARFSVPRSSVTAPQARPNLGVGAFALLIGEGVGCAACER